MATLAIDPGQYCYRRHVRTCLAGAALLAVSLGTVAHANEFPSKISLSSLNGTNGFRLDGAAAYDLSGWSVSSAGDVNGDGFGDVIVGAPHADLIGNRAGLSYVVFGRKSGFPTSLDLSTVNGRDGFRLDGVAVYDYCGWSVSSAGDVNGDGFADLIIGARNADPHGSHSGSSYVVFGRKSGFAASLNLSTLNGRDGFRLDGAAGGDFSGVSVSTAGDVNGDGFADLIIGAFNARPNGLGSGSSYVVFGNKSGFAATFALSTLNGSNGFRLDGVAYDQSGISVSSAGDVNGDGFADLIIGAPGASPHGSVSGSTYVVFGRSPSSGGLAASLNLSSLNGSNGFRLDGVAGGDHSGLSVSSAGDVNGDGFGDVIIGAKSASPNGEGSGSSYVVFGRKAGFPAKFALSSLDGSNGFRLDGAGFLDESGTSVSGAGDINGDGFADLIVGAPFADSNGLASGSSYVVFGRKSGFPARLALSSLNGRNGFRLDGAFATDVSGFSVSSAGDVNGDGFGDLIIGAYSAQPYGENSGAAFVVFGRAPDGPRTRVGSPANQYISGGPFADTLRGRRGRDSLEGRGGADMLQGGLGFDRASYRHAPAGVIADLDSPGANSGNAAGDSYDSIENLVGSSFNDTLRGNSEANVLTGRAGSDTLTGRGGNDIFRYLRVTDSRKGLKRDRITDFNPGTASTFVDRIDLRAIDAKPRLGGNQTFVYRGTLPFTGTSGEIRIKLAGGNVIVEGNINKGTVADFEIELTNLGSLANFDASDFIR